MPPIVKEKGIYDYFFDFGPFIIIILFSTFNIIIILYFYRHISRIINRLLSAIPPQSYFAPRVSHPFSVLNLNEPSEMNV